MKIVRGEEYLTQAEVIRLTGLNVRTVKRIIDMPKPVNITGFRPMYKKIEIDKWLDKKLTRNTTK